MSATASLDRSRSHSEARGIDPDLILNALTAAIIVVDGDNDILHVNNSAEQFFKLSASQLLGRKISSQVPVDSPMMSLIRQARVDNAQVSEYGVHLETPRYGPHFVNIHANPVTETPDRVVIALQERSIADTIERQLTHRGAARSVAAMAAMLAHEVKNPLSGIRGAAQLLEQDASEEDKSLTQLIRDEADRIVALVNRMDIFTDTGPVESGPVNIHRVLNHVLKLAEHGFGRHVKFIENYDPSLPPVRGNRDQLIQVFLNLIKNAVEAAPQNGGEVVLTTAYQHAVRFAVPSSRSQIHLPLMVSIQDNGEGIPDDIRGFMFDAFVTSKPKGSGLGLALTAKIIDDHGGIIEFDSQKGRTTFTILLPMDDTPYEEEAL